MHAPAHHRRQTTNAVTRCRRSATLNAFSMLRGLRVCIPVPICCVALPAFYRQFVLPPFGVPFSLRFSYLDCYYLQTRRATFIHALQDFRSDLPFSSACNIRFVYRFEHHAPFHRMRFVSVTRCHCLRFFRYEHGWVATGCWRYVQTAGHTTVARTPSWTLVTTFAVNR